MSIKLSVNINKIATIRNARGTGVPDLIKCAKDIQEFGAEGITIHPRPDERHITLKDTYDLKEVVYTEYNIEGYPDERYLKIIREIKPTQATLVPDPPHVLTSNAGWNTIENKAFLKKIIAEIKSYGVRTSLFIENDKKMLEAAAECGTDRVELFTGPYAENFHSNKEKAIAPYIETASDCQTFNLGINAGHDLNTDNLAYFKQHIPRLLEVSIGHALISDALYWGLENTINIYKRLLK